MVINTDLLGLRDQGGEEAFTIENLVIFGAGCISKRHQKKFESSIALVERPDMSHARVSQIFFSNNPDLKTIAKIAYALAEDFEIIREEDLKELPRKKNLGDYRPYVVVADSSIWRDNSRSCDTRLAA